MKILRISIQTIYWILLVVLIFIAGLSILSTLGIPKQFQPFVVLSGSMEPAIDTGSLIIITPHEDYRAGDIITFKKNPEASIKNANSVVTHRVYEKVKYSGKDEFYITKGDANNSPDNEPVYFNQIIGKVALNLPYLGYPVGFGKTLTGYILLIIVPATIIIYSEILKLKNEFSILFERRNKKETEITKLGIEKGTQDENVYN
jgi:signal peptidase